MNPPSGGAGTVDESRLALALRGRETPLYLTVDRISNIDVDGWQATIRQYLRAHGWAPFEERGESQPAVEETTTDAPIELLTVQSATAEYTLRAHVRRFELVLESEDRTFGDANAVVSRVVIGPEELDMVTGLLLAETGDRRRYDAVDPRERLPALLLDLFVEPYELDAMTELTEWLDEREIPYRFASSAYRPS